MRVLKINDSDKLGLVFMYDESLIALCRELKEEIGWQNFGWNKEHRAWTFEIHNLTKVLQKFPMAECNIAVIEMLKEHEKQRAVIALKQTEALKSIEVGSLPLFDYQKQGVAFLVNNPKALLADEMGLGKSIQAIAIIKLLNLNNVLIVCPASLKSNWQREISKWINQESYIIDKTFVDGINIVNYERLSKITNTKEWELIITDEAQNVKNPKAIRTKHLKKLAKQCPRIILLTGTPLLNRPVELVSQLDIMGKLKELGGEWWFKQTYCNGHQDKWGHWDFSGASNIDKLKDKISPFVLRRTKTEVLKDLPPKTVETLLLDLPEPKMYEAVKKQLREDLDNAKSGIKDFYRNLKGMNEVQKAMYLDGLAQNTEYKAMLGTAMKSLEYLKQETVRQKLSIIKDILDPFMENKTKCVVFGSHRQTIIELSKLYTQSVSITGETDIKQRQSLVDKFQDDPETIFFFGTLRASGTGITLTSASNVMFIELDWTPAIHAQAEDRIYRIGTKYPVTIFYTIMKDTIEEDIAEMLMDKSQVIDSLLSGKILQKLLVRNLL